MSRVDRLLKEIRKHPYEPGMAAFVKVVRLSKLAREMERELALRVRHRRPDLAQDLAVAINQLIVKLPPGLEEPGRRQRAERDLRRAFYGATGMRIVRSRSGGFRVRESS